MTKPKTTRPTRPSADDRRRQVISAITRSVESRGFPPTMREIASEVGICPARVKQLIDECEKHGLVERNAKAARSYRIPRRRPSPRS